MNLHDLQTMQDCLTANLIDNTRLSGNWTITADYHCTTVHFPTIEKMLAISDEQKTDNLLIVGDFFTFDVLSQYSRKQGGNNQDVKLSAEIQFGIDLMKEFKHQFKRIVYTMGNHEARYSKALNNALSFSVIAEFLKIKRLQFIDSYHCYLDNIRCTHPKEYSRVKLSKAIMLADKFQCDIIQAHGHFCSMGFSRSGYRVVDIGCMADWQRIPYMNMGDTTHPFWNNGFAIYKDKQIYVYGKGFGI